MLGLHRLLRRWHARKGRLVVLPSVPSPELDNRRDLYIYVPAAPARGDSRYPVIYMQDGQRSEEHTSELQSQSNLVCRLLLEKKKAITMTRLNTTLVVVF